MSRKHFPERIRSLPSFAGAFDAFQLSATDCEVLFASYPAGTEIEPHTHPTENCGVVTEGELILIVDGAAEVTVAGQSVRAAAGTFVPLPASVPHALHALEPFKMLLVMLRESASG